jgi:hypothetical protein
VSVTVKCFLRLAAGGANWAAVHDYVYVHTVSLISILIMKLSTPPAIPVRWIGRVDGPDRPNKGHFTKKPFHLAKFIPEVHGFLHMNPKLSRKYVCSSWFYIWTSKLSGKYVSGKYVAVYNFPKKDLELRNNPPENPTIYDCLRMRP